MTATPKENDAAYRKGYIDGYFEGLGADNPHSVAKRLVAFGKKNLIFLVLIAAKNKIKLIKKNSCLRLLRLEKLKSLI